MTASAVGSLLTTDASAPVGAQGLVHMRGHADRGSVRRLLGAFEWMSATFSRISSGNRCPRVSVERGARFRSGFGLERNIERLAGLPSDCAAGREQLERTVDGLVASVVFGRRRVETWPREGTIAEFRACSERRVSRVHFGANG